MDNVRKHYIFTGRVQHVGFRDTAYYAARLYGITGWVRNCYDGSVEMETEVIREDIEAMLSSVECSPFIRIDGPFSKVAPRRHGNE